MKEAFDQGPQGVGHQCDKQVFGVHGVETDGIVSITASAEPLGGSCAVLLEGVNRHMDAAAAGDKLTTLARSCPAIAAFFVQFFGPHTK